jgi:hypothetical protein
MAAYRGHSPCGTGAATISALSPSSPQSRGQGRRRRRSEPLTPALVSGLRANHGKKRAPPPAGALRAEANPALRECPDGAHLEILLQVAGPVTGAGKRTPACVVGPRHRCCKLVQAGGPGDWSRERVAPVDECATFTDVASWSRPAAPAAGAGKGPRAVRKWLTARVLEARTRLPGRRLAGRATAGRRWGWARGRR